MSARKRVLAWLFGGVALLAVGIVAMFLLARGCTSGPPPPLVLSKETTWFTGPLLPDGGIDWVAAIAAEAREEGLKDEENGAPLLIEAASAFVSAWTFAEQQEPYASAPDSTNAYADIEEATEALERGELEAPHVDLLLRWLDANAAVFDRLRAAAERPGHFLTDAARPLSLVPTRERIRPYYEWIQAIRLRLAARAARGDIDGALADAATACALARRLGSPATSVEQMQAVSWEVAVLEQLLRFVRSGSKLPADRALAAVEARPPRWTGETALREALRAERLVATSHLDHARFADEAQLIPASDPDIATLRAFRRADPNPPFRRLQQLFDSLDQRLLDSARPAQDRLGELHAELERRYDASATSKHAFLQSMRYSLLSDDELALRFVDLMVRYQGRIIDRCIADWLSLTAKRDALLAELAFLAGAPARRDSWVGEPLVVTRNQEDGTIAVSGALIELARGLDPKFDEEE